MTEAEWLACTDPVPMLEFLRGKASARKLRLFAVACCRRIWQRLPGESAHQAVEVAERFADGRAGSLELAEAHDRAAAEYETQGGKYLNAGPVFWATAEGKPLIPIELAWLMPAGWVTRRAQSAAGLADWYAYEDAVRRGQGKRVSKFVFEADKDAFQPEGRMQADLLRCLFGNLLPSAGRRSWWRSSTRALRFLFCHPVRRIAPSRRTPRVLTLAQAIYDERAFDRLPLLAEALEEAGCDSAALLAHCRGPGPHVRGCWSVDAILGKE